MTQIEQIKKEVERNKAICKKVVLDLLYKGPSKDYYQGKTDAYNQVQIILNNIEAKGLQAEAVLPGTEEEAGMVAGRDYVPVDWVETLDEYGKWKIVPVETESEEAILRRAIEVYGSHAQINMALEEMGELIVALQHGLRGRASHVEVCEEVADVQIMMKQLAMMFDKDIVRKYYESKIKRLEQRLNNED